MKEDSLNNYVNFISLGFFCGVAQDLEAMGLRATSSPFDWTISNFKEVIRAMDNEFDSFMCYENLKQNTIHKNYYWDETYDIQFFHDFSKYKSLEEQYIEVREKYQRRIDRFLTNIKKPTLFIRYINADKQDNMERSKELIWIEDNYEYIEKVLKKYNSNNEIIYIGDENLKSEIIKLYNVKIDINDIVARHPLINNEKLFYLLNQYNIPNKEENIKKYLFKQELNKKLSTKLIKKCKSGYYKYFKKEFDYNKKY